jgi:hypothetical protein
MIVYGRHPVLVDASVLAKFLVVRRGDLLSKHPRYFFLVTSHIHRQFRDCYPDHCDSLADTIEGNHVESIESNTTEELQIFARLLDSRTFGAAECAAVATAHCRCWPLAIEDSSIAALAKSLQLSLSIENTDTLLVDLVNSGAIQRSAADQFKKNWEEHDSSWPQPHLADYSVNAQQN